MMNESCGTQEMRHHVAKRLRAWYDLAEVRHVQAGQAWYADARAFAESLVQTYTTADRPVSLRQTAGVLAALSPSVAWELNKRDCESMIRAWSFGQDPSSVTVSTYGKQAKKAAAIIRADDPSETEVRSILGKRAFKTWSFFDNIVNPASTDVTIDQHIVGAADIEEKWTQGAKWCYDMVSDVIREIAWEESLHPYQVQAILWITWKDIGDHKNNYERYLEREAVQADLPFVDDGIPI